MGRVYVYLCVCNQEPGTEGEWMDATHTAHSTLLA